MKNHLYILIGDNCEKCQFVSNAFTLFQLPLHTMTFRDLLDSDDEMAAANALFLCPEVETTHQQQIQAKIVSAHTHIVSFLPAAKNSPAQAHALKLPFTATELKHVLSSCHGELEHETELDATHPVFDRLLGQSTHIRKIRTMIKQVAYSDSTVLILGQSGTGKDVIASCIHYFSNRKKNPLVPINCGAIPSELIESELFGHEKGAFTGALTRRPGRFEIAHGGTLFLDEIGDMPLPMQVKLLRVIQDRLIERVGGNVSIKVDVRLIAATNRNLQELIEQNRFREDLFYRLNVFPIVVPSLAERSEDIPDLIEYHLNRIQTRLKHRVIFTDRAKDLLIAYPWPGNIRELENFLERMVILHPDSVIDEKDLDAAYKTKKENGNTLAKALTLEKPLNFKDYITDVERQIIEYALEKSNGMINAAADYLSMGKKTFIEKMKKYNLDM